MTDFPDLARITMVSRCLLLFAIAAWPTLAADPGGTQIYLKKCASCHGDEGQGTPKYKRPLVGDKTVPQLAQLITKTMPEDNPGTCVGPEAAKVAAYVHEAFYSVAARDRNKPPRVELARLTVKQYRNAVADLVGSFRFPPKSDPKPGLRGEYFAARGFQQNKRIIDRTDSEVKFDFGSGTPMEGKFEPHEYSIKWEGSVLAPETGEYEFIVRTEFSMRLWVNQNKIALIDAWVKSGTDIEFRGSLYLIAGRSYPIRLEFTKSQQGVNEPKKAKELAAKKASVALLWKLPHRVPEVIPARNLSTAKVTESYVPASAFPPDDRSLGWERGTTISKAWDQATTDAAIDAANFIASNLNEFAGTKEANADRAAKLKEFSRRFVERAFRRPLTAEEKQMYVDRQFELTMDLDLAVKRVVLLTLKSPRFLYRESGNSGYAVASRLSFALWDSLPDDELLRAAGAGKLTTREEVARQAERMLNDPRAKVKLREFLHAWLKVDHARDVAKDPKRFPDFEPTIIGDLQTSLDLFLDDVIWSQASDFRRLLLDEQLFLNGKLAKFYGHTLPADADFKQVKLEGGERAGILTHPYLLTAFAYTGSTSPIHRGVFLARGVLGIGLKPPPDAFTPLAEALHPNLTTRERVLLQTKPAACQTCHNVINPLGFALERYDAVGRYRDKDNGKPIDATGTYETRKGDTVKFAGARELAGFLAKGEEVHAAFAEQMFHHLIQQPVRAYGPNTLTNLRQEFAKSGFNVRKLAVEVATITALPVEEKKVPTKAGGS